MAPPITHWLRRAPLGSGSFGQVSLATNLDNGLCFAVKSTLCAGSSAELDAIETELAILQSIRCPQVISCFGGGFCAGNGEPSRNLFLEYMDGGSVAEMVKKSGGCLDELRVRSYTRAILQGLAYLHEQGIVHCDIKGQNILLSSCGVKIADFGAAKKLSEEMGAQNFRGTPLWMAPEVIQGKEQRCPSDVWSLGCTVVEMLQGTPPWRGFNGGLALSGSSIAAILYKIGYSEEKAPLPAAISPNCHDFLSKALHRDPAHRWSADQLLNHPWLQATPEMESYSSQPSPRSTLDFLPDSDDDEHGTCGSVAPAHLEGEATTGHTEPFVADACIPESSEWITVRSAESWPVSKQKKPFTTKPALLRRGREVELGSVSFFRRRRTTV